MCLINGITIVTSYGFQCKMPIKEKDFDHPTYLTYDYNSKL